MAAVVSEAGIKNLIEAINADPELGRRGRYYTCEVKLVVSGEVPVSLLFRVEDGALTSVERDVDRVPDGITLAATPDVWSKFRAPNPSPGFHDLAAMQSEGHLDLSGDILRWLSNMAYVRGLVDHWRRADVWAY